MCVVHVNRRLEKQMQNLEEQQNELRQKQADFLKRVKEHEQMVKYDRERAQGAGWWPGSAAWLLGLITDRK